MTLGEFTGEENFTDYKQYKIANDFDTYIKQKNKVMEANEAPEKIWVHELAAMELDVPLKAYHVEYVRADAFIEKACAWLKESVTNNPECNRIISKKGVITMGELIDEFKKYMEGE